MKLRAVNYKFLGSILYYYRNDHKYSREKLVKIIYDDTHKSISAKTIQRIEEGTTSKLDDVYADIAKVYGFDFIKDDLRLSSYIWYNEENLLRRLSCLL